MDLGRFLVDAVALGRASPTELARTHPISRKKLRLQVAVEAPATLATMPSAWALATAWS